MNLVFCEFYVNFILWLIIQISQEQMDAVIDRKESLKQELKNTQDELQTCKDSHRYISDVYNIAARGYVHHTSGLNDFHENEHLGGTNL